MIQTADARMPEKDSFSYAFTFKKVDAEFDRLWQMKSSARESLKDWLLVSGVSPKHSEICANACSELIENCIKYCREGSIANVTIRVENAIITVETFNRATSQHHQKLTGMLTQIRSSANLEQLFVETLILSTSDKSQVGLIKIAMETKGSLTLVSPQHDEILHLVLKMTV